MTEAGPAIRGAPNTSPGRSALRRRCSTAGGGTQRHTRRHVGARSRGAVPWRGACGVANTATLANVASTKGDTDVRTRRSCVSRVRSVNVDYGLQPRRRSDTIGSVDSCRRGPISLQRIHAVSAAAASRPGRTRGAAHPPVFRSPAPADRAPPRGGASPRNLRARLGRRHRVGERAQPGRAHHPARARRRPARTALHPHRLAPRLPVRVPRRDRGGRGRRRAARAIAAPLPGRGAFGPPEASRAADAVPGMPRASSRTDGPRASAGGALAGIAAGASAG